MNISRHNYEEYFILYMDNELSSNDRRMVEIFVQQHPDLKDELAILFQYKLYPDNSITYNGKEDLMKLNGDAPVTLSNYEEWLVLYMDNELTADQKTIVDTFLAANPSAQENFILLQRTQLQPEEIIFAEKTSLYRKEEKVRPLPVRWWRIAAAAVLLLGIGITTAVVINKKSGDKEIVKRTEPGIKASPNNLVVDQKGSNTPVNESTVADINNKVTTPGNMRTPNKTVVVKNNLIKNPLPIKIITPQPIKEQEVLVVNNNPTNDLPLPLNNPNINKNDATNKAIAIDNTSKEIIKQKDALTIPVVTTTNPQPSNIVNASFTNNNDAEINQSDNKKNKNRGLFRKIARNFERRTNIDPTDDNKLLVAGLALKLK